MTVSLRSHLRTSLTRPLTPCLFDLPSPHSSPLTYLLPSFTTGFSPATEVALRRAVIRCLQVSSVGDCSGGQNGPIGEWDVSRVTDMKTMFSDAKGFNHDISNWDVSSVTSMKWMFSDAQSFNSDISDWSVSRVTDMRGMFYHAQSFNSYVSHWDVSSVTDMNEMFRYATSFSQTLCGEAWVNSQATKTDMFDGSSGSISTTVCGSCFTHSPVTPCNASFLSLYIHTLSL